MIDRRTRVRLGGLVLTALAAGCGPRFGDVAGKVSFQGQPLTTGTIAFYDQANGVASSPIQADGTYAVHKVRAGPVRITVAMPTGISFAGPQGPGAGPLLPFLPPAVPWLPARYQDPEQSGLTFEVEPGTQEFDVALE
jgi:hypothetical protein